MEKFKFGIFDVFTYTMPGVVLLLSIPIWKMASSFSINEVLKYADQYGSSSIIIILILSYVIGFVDLFFGYILFSNVALPFWCKDESKKGKLSSKEITTKQTYVRLYCKECYSYIESFYALRGMAFNLSSAFIFITIILLIKIIFFWRFEFNQIILVLTSLSIAVICLKQSVTFHKWAHDSIDAAIEMEKSKRT